MNYQDITHYIINSPFVHFYNGEEEIGEIDIDSLAQEHIDKLDTHSAFIQECPAYARQAGISDINQWNIVKLLMPLSNETRMDELNKIKDNIEKCLIKSDELMPTIQKHNKGITSDGDKYES